MVTSRFSDTELNKQITAQDLSTIINDVIKKVFLPGLKTWTNPGNTIVSLYQSSNGNINTTIIHCLQGTAPST